MQTKQAPGWLTRAGPPGEGHVVETETPTGHRYLPVLLHCPSTEVPRWSPEAAQSSTWHAGWLSDPARVAERRGSCLEGVLNER